MSVRIMVGDCRASMDAMVPRSVDCCVTSPPYWGLRDYGVDGQLGMEETPEEYVAAMVGVFRSVRRVLRDDGTLWLNLGDSYAANRAYQVHNTRGAKDHTHEKGSTVPPGLKPKDLVGIPWRVAFALQADGWYLRSDIIWHKPNPMPESVTDRPTKSHEYVFLLSKSERYAYDAAAISEPVAPSTVARLAQPTLAQQVGSDRVPGKTNGNMKACAPRFGGNKYGGSDAKEHRTKSGNEYVLTDNRNARTVWSITTQPFSGAHFATMPPVLAERCILAGCPEGLANVVLDPFGGAGTTGLVAHRLGRSAVLCELSEEYARMAEARIREDAPMFSDVRIEQAGRL